MSEHLIINGVNLKTPKSFSVGIQSIDSSSSGRNANGDMVRDVIAQKVKLEVEWGPLNAVDMGEILRNIDSAFFTVRYFDPKEAGMLTKTFYAGDRSSPVYSWNEKFQEHMWQGLKVDFVEQ